MLCTMWEFGLHVSAQAQSLLRVAHGSLQQDGPSTCAGTRARGSAGAHGSAHSHVGARVPHGSAQQDDTVELCFAVVITFLTTDVKEFASHASAHLHARGRDAQGSLQQDSAARLEMEALSRFSFASAASLQGLGGLHSLSITGFTRRAAEPPELDAG